MKRLFFILILFFLGGFLSGCESEDDAAVTPKSSGSTIDSSFVRIKGSGLVVGSADQAVFLRGLNLSYDRLASDVPGEDWKICDDSDWGSPVTGWYQKKHFQQISTIGFNTVRLNLCYRIFEDNAAPGVWKESGWTLLDQLITWAETYDLYLIIDIHVAPGGAGIISCLGCGWKTWDQTEYQTRFINLWKAIASRYADQPRIAAYDLLNEPAPTQEAAQWQTMAQNLVDAIRTVDKNHLIIMEMVNWIFNSSDQSPLSDYNSDVLSDFQFLINDNQVLYDFHYYLPSAYTLQDETGVDGGIYPDSTQIETTISGLSMPRDSTYLKSEVDTVLKFWQDNGVIVNFGEWGTADSAILGNAKGGITYISDILKITDNLGIHWQFYYFNRLYRIDCCYDDNPTTVIEQDLVDLFQQYFSGTLSKTFSVHHDQP